MPKEAERIQVRDRILELRRVPASSLLPNPKNWRVHPARQQAAMRGVLNEVGIADAVLARENEHGQLVLVDGHLRTETLGDGLVPVLVLDVTAAEADVLLATIDPIAAMAATDHERMHHLLEGMKVKSDALMELLAQQRAPEPPSNPGDAKGAFAVTLPTQAEIDQRQGEMQTQFRQESITKKETLVTLLCPECGAEFKIRQEDIGKVGAGDD